VATNRLLTAHEAIRSGVQCGVLAVLAGVALVETPFYRPLANCMVGVFRLLLHDGGDFFNVSSFFSTYPSALHHVRNLPCRGGGTRGCRARTPPVCRQWSHVRRICCCRSGTGAARVDFRKSAHIYLLRYH